LWLNTIAWTVAVAVGKGAKRMLICPLSSGSVRRERSSCLAGERGLVIFGYWFSRFVCFLIRNQEFLSMGEVLLWSPQVLRGRVVLPFDKELMSPSRVSVCNDRLYFIFRFSFYKVWRWF